VSKAAIKLHNELVKTIDLMKYFEESTGNLIDYAKRKKRVVRAVDGVSLAIHQFETLGLVGESGCGKSTFGRLVMRLYEPTSGKIIFKGTDISNLSNAKMKPLRKNMQLVFQNPYSSLNPRKTLRQIIGQPLKAHNVSGNRKQQTLQLLNEVGLDETFANKYPHELSGGQRQRVAIARSISLNPEFVILDEVTSALDASVQAQILNLLTKLQDEFGLSYLVISHDLSAVRQISHRIAVMYLGRIVEYASADEVFDNPLHPYTQILMKAIPLPDINIPWEPTILKGEPPSPAKVPSGCRFYPRCPFAMGICKTQDPFLMTPRSNHIVECHLYD